MKIETNFRASYQVEVATELPSSGVGVCYFPPVVPGRGRLYEASLRFTQANGNVWWGVFGAVSKDQLGLYLASGMPDIDACFVSCYGTGYVVNAQNPEEWYSVDLYPIIYATALIEPQLFILNDFTRMAAYGVERRSPRWATPPLCSDELRIVSARNTIIECVGWDAATSSEVVVRVDSSSGAIKNKVSW